MPHWRRSIEQLTLALETSCERGKILQHLAAIVTAEHDFHARTESAGRKQLCGELARSGRPYFTARVRRVKPEIIIGVRREIGQQRGDGGRIEVRVDAQELT